MKKITALLCAAAMVLSLAACSSGEDNSAYAGTTVTGEVSEIDGNKVTVTLGELTEEEMPDWQQPGGDGETPPSKPDESGTDSSETATQTPPEGKNGAGGGETPPSKPDTDTAGDGQASGEAPSEAENGAQGGETPPDGNGDAGDGETPPDKPDGEGGGMGGKKTFTATEGTLTFDISSAEITKDGESATAQDIASGDILQITFDENGKASAVEIVNLEGGMGGGGFGGSGEVTQGDSANTITEDGTYTDTTYTSTGDDENALRVDGATVTLDGITVDKSAGATSNTENGDFYGMNAALLATNGATVTIKNATVTSSAQNGNGVFSYGSGTTVNISDSTITTTADNSGGIQTTGGGTTNASNLTVETSGSSAAAIRSDRGGGTVNVTGGSYTSNGYNSPAVYSTADITVSSAQLVANNSEALVIEGKNSITLTDCDVVGNMSDTNGTSSDENVHNVMIYQSMSGDADVGTSEFSMTGGSLTSKNGDMIYVTNTHCIIAMSGVEIENEDSDAYLLRVVGNSAKRGWGNAGSNGAQVEFTADSQTLEGDIIVDTISTLTMTLKNGSVFTGTINITDNAEGGTAVSDNAVVTIGSGCTWNLTGDCTITSLENNGTVNYNGYTITLADGTVLK